MIFYRVIPGFLTQFGTCLFKRCASLYVPACCSNVVLHCDRLASAPTSLFLLQNCYCASSLSLALPHVSCFCNVCSLYHTSVCSFILPHHHIGLLPPSSHATTSVCSLHNPTPPHRTMHSTLGALPRVVYRLPHVYPPHRSAFRWFLHLIATLTLAPPRTHARTRVRATIIGVPSDPKQFAKWNPQQFDDEPNLKEFKRGTISYAGAGVNSRSCHLFIAFGPGQ